MQVSTFFGYGGKYEVLRNHLTDEQIIGIVKKISSSNRFEFGELSHIVLRGTETIVGYLGNETAELCFPERGKYNLHHLILKRIFRSV